MAPESHLWRGWGRQDSGRLRKKEKWGTWKERNRNPPGLPNLPFSEKEKKKEFGIKRKQNFYEQTKWAIVVVQRQDLRNTFTIVFLSTKIQIFAIFLNQWFGFQPTDLGDKLWRSDRAIRVAVENAIMKVSALVFELINILKARFFRHCFRQTSGIGLAFSLVLSLVCSYRCFKDKIFDPIFNPLNDSLCLLLLWDLFPN